jgi:hypothetical protein
MIGSAIFNNTSGGIAVGPGASKYLFCIVNLLDLVNIYPKISAFSEKQNSYRIFKRYLNT